jgi:two-component system, probable response regulator PhcQ
MNQDVEMETEHGKFYDYKKFAILYVDDEEKSLTNISRARSATNSASSPPSNAQDGFKLLEQHADEIGLLMTDQRMPGEKGVWLLERARQLRPRILRCSSRPMRTWTPRSPPSTAARSTNTSPSRGTRRSWNLTLRQGLEFFMVQAERDQLLHEKMSVLRNMMIADRIVSLGLLAAGLSHHIRNSLVAVKTFLDLAPMKMAEEKRANMNGLRNPDFWKDYHQNVQSQIEKINSLLADLRTASDSNSATQFADEVFLRRRRRALEMFKEQFAARRIEIENQIPDSLPRCARTSRNFTGCLNCCSRTNWRCCPPAAKFRSRRNCKHRREAGNRRAITDNGPGLPQEALRVVFDPFVVRAARRPNTASI